MLGNLLAVKVQKPRKKIVKRVNFFLDRPRVLKYPRSFKKSIKNKVVSHRSVSSFLRIGALGFKSLSPYRLRVKQLESVRKLMFRVLKKRKVNIMFGVAFNNPLTKKGLGVRMGKGKGKLDSFVCNINAGRIFLEVDGFDSVLDSFKNKFMFGSLQERLPFKTVSVSRF